MSRFPPKREMSLAVRASYRVWPETPAAIEAPAELGTLSGDVFAEGDDDRVGALLRASDFADHKPRTDLLLRASCHSGDGQAVRELTCRFRVGGWSKSLRVSGKRVWTDRPDAPISTPEPFVSLPIGYEHAFGGPAYARNPVGIGLDSRQLPQIEDPNALIRSRQDRPEPAGFGPISPNWPQRKLKQGTRYDKEWKKTRAPFYAADFDWGYFNAAPLDQQLPLYLHGHEEISFDYLLPGVPHVSRRLPAIRARAFLRYVTGENREIDMNLDTLAVDLVLGRLDLTWRGLAPVSDDDFEDVRVLWVTSESLYDPRPDEEHIARLDAILSDPLDVLSPAQRASWDDGQEKLGALRALRADLDGKGSTGNPTDQLRAILAEHLDGKPEAAASIEKGLAQLTESLEKAKATAATAQSPLAGMASSEQRALSDLAARRAAVAARGESTTEVDQAIASLRQAQDRKQAALSALQDQASGADAGKTAGAAMALGVLNAPGGVATNVEPAPGAFLFERDLSGVDLHGRNLERAVLMKARLVGANLRGARLKGANLLRADLTEADLTGADLSKAILMEACLKGARLDDAILPGASFMKADLAGASLVGASGDMVVFANARMGGARLGKVRFRQALFDHTVLDDADFRDALLEGCMFLEASLERARFDRSILTKTSFMKCAAKGACFYTSKGERTAWMGTTFDATDASHVDWPHANFMNARLGVSSFFGSGLRGARFERATLARTSLDRCNLMGANFGKARLLGTSFVGACLYGARFIDAVKTDDCDFTDTNVKGALWELP